MKPFTHLYVMNVVLDHVRKNKGYVDIPPYGRFSVNKEFAELILSGKYDTFFRAGSIGPDGFPDMLTGQSEMHVSTDGWLEYLYWRCRQQKVPGIVNGLPTAVQDKQSLAFYVGFLSHCCADIWAHDWVNYYAGDKWPDTALLAKGNKTAWTNISKHIAIEMTLDERVKATNSRMVKTVDVPNGFMVNLIVNSTKARLMRGSTKEGPHTFLIFDRMFVPLYWALQEFKNAQFLHLYSRAWYNDVKTGISEWVKCNEKAIKAVAAGNSMASQLKSNWSSWANIHFLSMCGAPDLLTKIPAKFREMIDIEIPLFKEFKKFIADTVCKKITGMTTQQLETKLKGRVTKSLFGSATYDKLINEIGSVPAYTSWNHKSTSSTNINGPLYNSIIMTKMSLLDSTELKRLYKVMNKGKGILTGTIRRVPHEVRMLDGSGQFRFGVFGKFYTKMMEDEALKTYTSHSAKIKDYHGRGTKVALISDVIRNVSIMIKTKNQFLAGTDADIYFDILFQSGYKKVFKLDKSGYNDFEQGDDDWYHFWWNQNSKHKTSTIKAIYVRMGKHHGVGNDWDCHHIHVQFNGGMTHYYKINKCFKKVGQTWSKSFSNGMRLS